MSAGRIIDEATTVVGRAYGRLVVMIARRELSRSELTAVALDLEESVRLIRTTVKENRNE